MPRPCSDLSTNFINHIQSLEATRQKMESLLLNGTISLDDIEQVYTGLYLSVFTEFEGLIEELFFGLLSGDLVSPNIVCTVPSSNSTTTRQILMIGKDYLDWLPIDKTIVRANVIFQNGEPFTLLTDSHKQKLKQFVHIRHVIAHKSEHAQRQFERHVIGNRTLLPREKTPAGFLRSRFRNSPVQIQYQLVIYELEAMALLLCR